jgi:hypothetical protein
LHREEEEENSQLCDYFLHDVPGRLLPRLFAVTGLLALGLF